MALRTRWMRRSEFMNVPSRSNDEATGKNTLPALARDFVEEHVLDDDELERVQRLRGGVGVWIRQGDVVADGPERLEFAVTRSVHHLHQIQSFGVWHRRAPDCLEQRSRLHRARPCR